MSASDHDLPDEGSLAGFPFAPLSGAGALESLGAAVANTGEGSHPFETHEQSRYQHPQVLAQGGMGRVSTVTDTRLGREVALKEILISGAPESASLERRLTQEAWITAQLEHPGIVPVYDAGKNHLGRLFFTMRLIRGRSLAQALADGDLKIPALLRRFLTVCQAMGYAHAMGVMHRDLKPANLMLGTFGETQIVDWGLARHVNQSDSDGGGPTLQTPPTLPSAHTMHGALVGTPAYMSPEQATRGETGITSDVWSLGAVLAEIIAGRPLFEGQSTPEVLAHLARNERPELDVLAPSAAPELIAIATRALSFRPEDRYRNAEALADDIAAYLDGRRVGAFAYSPWDVAKRFGRAFRLPLLVGSAALMAIAAVFGVTYAQTVAQRDRAQTAESATQEALSRALDAEYASAAAFKNADKAFAQALVQRAQGAVLNGARAEAETLAAHALMRGPSPEARGVLARWALKPPLTLLSAIPPPPCRDSTLSPTGKKMLCVEPDATALFDTQDGGLIWRIPFLTDSVFFASETVAAAEPPLMDEQSLSLPYLIGIELTTGQQVPVQSLGFVSRARVGGGIVFEDHSAVTLAIWDSNTNTQTHVANYRDSLRGISGDGSIGLFTVKPAEQFRHVTFATMAIRPITAPIFVSAQGPTSVGINRTGTRAAIGGTKGTLAMVDLTTDTVLWRRRPTKRMLREIRWSPGGGWLAVRDERGLVTLVSAHGTHTYSLPRIRAAEVRWSDGPSGLVLTVLGEEIRRYHVPKHPAADSYQMENGLATLSLCEKAERLALPDGNGAVGIFDVQSGTRLERLPGNGRVAKSVALWSNPRRTVVNRMGAPSMVEWTDDIRKRRTMENLGPFRRIFPMVHGMVAAPFARDLRDFPDHAPFQSFPMRDRSILKTSTVSSDRRTVAWLTDEGHLGSATSDGTRLNPPNFIGLFIGAHALALNHNGARIALSRGNEIHLIETQTGEPVVEMIRTASPISVLALSGDDEQVAAGLMDGSVEIWRISDGTLLMRGVGHHQRISGLEYGPESDWLISASWDRRAIRWGLDGLERDPAELVRTRENQWGISLSHALTADLR